MSVGMGIVAVGDGGMSGCRMKVKPSVWQRSEWGRAILSRLVGRKRQQTSEAADMLAATAPLPHHLADRTAPDTRARQACPLNS